MESYVHAKEVVKRVKGVTFSGGKCFRQNSLFHPPPSPYIFLVRRDFTCFKGISGLGAQDFWFLKRIPRDFSGVIYPSFISSFFGCLLISSTPGGRYWSKYFPLTLSDTPIVLIANKRDKENQRCVGKQEYIDFCDAEGVELLELSAALFTETLDLAFEFVYKQLHASLRPEDTSPSPLMKKKHKKHVSRSLDANQFHKLIVHARPESTFVSTNDLSRIWEGYAVVVSSVSLGIHCHRIPE